MYQDFLIEINNFYKDIFDWCFPELIFMSVSEYSGEYLLYFCTDKKNITVSLSDWVSLTEKNKHLIKYKTSRRILS